MFMGGQGAAIDEGQSAAMPKYERWHGETCFNDTIYLLIIQASMRPVQS
jgi:hypothetical protein